MATPNITPSGREITFHEQEIIVSKTDTRGVMTYVNPVFERVSGYTEAELLGQPHNLIRHPDMPRSVFKLLWDVIASGEEIFAYVNNMARNGDNYWVFAHVTPTFDAAGGISGYHSSRRVPEPSAVQKVIPLYRELLAIERGASSKGPGLVASTEKLMQVLDQAGIDYPEFVFSL